MWQDAPLSHMTALSPIFHFNASHLLTSPSLFWTGAPNNLPGVSKMKASSFSPLRISSSGAWHAKTETVLAQISGVCPFPCTHCKPGLDTSPSCVLSRHNAYTPRFWMTYRSWSCYLLILHFFHPHSPCHDLHAYALSPFHAHLRARVHENRMGYFVFHQTFRVPH